MLAEFGCSFVMLVRFLIKSIAWYVNLRWNIMNIFKLSSVVLVATLVMGSALACGEIDRKPQPQDQADVQTD